MHKWNFLHTYTILLICEAYYVGRFVVNAEDVSCEQKSPCECQFPDGTAINIANLFSKKDTNGYLNATKDDLTIFYHGCIDMELQPFINNIGKEGCRDPLVLCAFYKPNRTLSILGKAELGHFGTDTVHTNMLKMSYTQDHANTSVLMVCTPDLEEDQIVIHSYDVNKKIYNIELISKHACRTSLPIGLSTGSKLLIMFCTFVSIYFIGGAALAYFVRGARGRELIPNVDFWLSVPGLVKDGVVFILGGCTTRLVTTSETYDQI